MTETMLKKVLPPPPPKRLLLAAFTTASISRDVMSPFQMATFELIFKFFSKLPSSAASDELFAETKVNIIRNIVNKCQHD